MLDNCVAPSSMVFLLIRFGAISVKIMFSAFFLKES